MVKKVGLPAAEAFFDAMKVSDTSIEAVEYLEQQSLQILKEAKLDRSESTVVLRTAIADFVGLMRLKLASTGQPWAGQAASDVAKQAAERITFSVAINKDADIKRGYLERGKILGADGAQQMDVLFYLWLMKNKKTIQGDTLFDTDEQGQIKMDKHGQLIKVDVDEMKRLIDDEDKGFKQFTASRGMLVEVQQQEYPTTELEAGKRQAVKEAFESVRMEQEQEEVLEAEKTQTTLGGG